MKLIGPAKPRKEKKQHAYRGGSSFDREEFVHKGSIKEAAQKTKWRTRAHGDFARGALGDIAT
jgi:hypothetical protein